MTQNIHDQLRELLTQARELLETRLTPETVDSLGDTLPAQIALLSKVEAKLWAEAQCAKEAHAVAESKARLAWSSKTSGGKPYTAKYIEDQARLDAHVQGSFSKWVAIEHQRRVVDAVVRALERKDGKIPGMQGRANQLTQASHRNGGTS